MFFNSKKFEIVDLTSSNILEVNKTTTLSFYVKDIFKETQITALSYLPIKKNGRDEVEVGTPISILDLSSDVYKFSYTPTEASSDFTFRIYATDVDSDEHILYIDTYVVKS